jgi:Right handed beta helix region
MNRPLNILLLLVLSCYPHLVAAVTIRVPGDVPTIQAAIESAAATDVVVVSAGVYRERLALKPGLTLRSEGDGARGATGLLRAERTIIDGSAGGDKPGVTMAEGAVLDGFTVTNVGAYDDASWQKHWTERGANQAHDDIGGFDAPGIGADGVNCRITHCIVHHNGATGIAVRGREGAAVHPVVTGNVCFRNMGGGIGAMRNVGGVIEGNHCYENFYAGIGHSVGAAPLVVGNDCHGNIRAGIGVSEKSRPVVRGNHCRKNRRAGIGIRTGAETRPVVEENRCIENGMAGIGVEDGAQPIVRGNICERNELAGIGLQGNAKALLVGNESRDNGESGIGLRAGCEALLWGNVCAGNRLVAVGLPEKAFAILFENTLSREEGMPPLIAVRGGSEAVLLRNKLDGGGVAGVLVEGRAILSDNEIKGRNEKFGQGIWVWKGGSVLAERNAVTGFKAASTVAEGGEWVEGRR